MLVEELREVLGQNQVPDDVTITYRVAGGIPGERFEETVVLRGSGEVQVRSRNMLGTGRPREADAELSEEETQGLLEVVVAEFESLIPRGEARFLPDSLVGVFTIHLDERDDDSRYFEVTEEIDAALGTRAPHDNPAVQSFDLLSRRLLGDVEVDHE